jgi:two-component system response regulator FitH
MATSGRVLVVDDDRDIVESVSIRLTGAGYEILVAFDGQQGVAMATSCKPDAIVLDVRMPKMDGMTALAKLKQHPATQDIPVVVLSASMCDQQAALLAGASFFVLKPYVPNDLLAALDSALGNGRPATSAPRAGHSSSIAPVASNGSPLVAPTFACTPRSS